MIPLIRAQDLSVLCFEYEPAAALGRREGRLSVTENHKTDRSEAK